MHSSMQLGELFLYAQPIIIAVAEGSIVTVIDPLPELFGGIKQKVTVSYGNS